MEGFYFGSRIGVPPFGIKAIYEGQARFSQLQYLYCNSLGTYTFDDFAKAGMLNGIYVEAFNFFLKVLNETCPQRADNPLIGLFLLICDIAINPVDGFPIDIYYYETFVISNDPAHRFCLMCQMVRDKLPHLKTAIQNYSREEYLTLSKTLSEAICCFAPYEGACVAMDWIAKQNNIQELLREETTYKYRFENLPVRLFFSKYLRFQQDKLKYPQFFCWPGLHFVGHSKNSIDLNTVQQLFETHKALFMDGKDGDIYATAFEGYDEKQSDETLNEFFSWNASYDMIRQWIAESGPFRFDYEWLSSKFSKEQMKIWACKNFEDIFQVHPKDFKIL